MILGKAISPFALRKKNGGGNDADAQAFITATGISGTNATATNEDFIWVKDLPLIIYEPKPSPPPFN
jgi:hypothetical protein